MKQRVLTVAAVAILGLAPAARQSTPVQDQRPVFRGSAVFVNVDVYPRRDGRVIEGLTKDDFEVFEDGKPQPVEKFEFIRVTPFTPDAEKRDPNTVSESLLLASDPHNRVFVIFLDTFNVTLPGSYYSREPLVTFLNRTIGPDDLFAVMTPEVPVERLTFARRTETIAAELQKFWFWGEADRLTPAVGRTSEYERAQRCGRYAPDPGKLNAEIAATALERLVEKMGALRDARSNILFVSEGWIPTAPLPPAKGTAPRPTLPRVGPTLGPGLTTRLGAGTDDYGNPDRNSCELWADQVARIDFQRRFKDLLLKAQQANVAFYSIDTGGLKTGFPTAKELEKIQPENVAAAISAKMDNLNLKLDTLRTLANETGGFAVVNTNDLLSGVRKISDDLSAFYLLGYYSTNTATDGRFRKIEVRVKAPDVKVSARRGYTAPTPEMLKAEAAAAAAPARVRTAADDARERLGRIRADARLHTAAVASPSGLEVIVELAGHEMANYRWNSGAAVTVTVTPRDGGAAISAQGKIAPGARSVLVSAPVGDAAGRAWRVTTRAVSGAESAEDAIDVTPPAQSGLGEPIVYRAMPSPRSIPQPSADPVFRRTERIHVRWGGTGFPGTGLENRVARLLGPQNDPLPVPVTVTERTEAGRTVLAADLVLAPLAAGDYVIELSGTRGAEKLTSYVAFRVTR
jgi:VWFA-related protein